MSEPEAGHACTALALHACARSRPARWSWTRGGVIVRTVAAALTAQSASIHQHAPRWRSPDLTGAGSRRRWPSRCTAGRAAIAMAYAASAVCDGAALPHFTPLEDLPGEIRQHISSASCATRRKVRSSPELAHTVHRDTVLHRAPAPGNPRRLPPHTPHPHALSHPQTHTHL